MKTCTKCGETKPLDKFSRDRRRRNGLHSCCKACAAPKTAEWLERHPGYTQVQSAVRVARLKADPDYRTKYEAQQKRWRQKIKAEVTAHYGGRCACCAEDEPLSLSIDHIDGGGNAHRKVLGSADIYLWLRKNGYPEGFQILCHNCNHGRWINGGTCPHQSLNGSEG